MVRSRSQGFASGPQIHKLWSVSEIWAWNYSPPCQGENIDSHWTGFFHCFEQKDLATIFVHFCASNFNELIMILLATWAHIHWQESGFVKMVSGHLWLPCRKNHDYKYRELIWIHGNCALPGLQIFLGFREVLQDSSIIPKHFFSVTWCSTACSVNWAAH